MSTIWIIRIILIVGIILVLSNYYVARKKYKEEHSSKMED